jgi:LmbE family N-acetylglucosaminyl deacetylase
MAKAKPTSKRIIDTAVPYEALPFYQVTKQADVLHAMKNLPWHFTRKQIETAFDYYLPKTAFDSSLAYSMFALMAARLGRPETALAFFDKCINLDIRNVQLNTISGLHFANFGGSWQAAVFGFGGVEVLKDRLAVSPVLPDRWKKLSFRLRYKDALLGIEAAQGYTRVTLLSEGKGPVNIELAGQRFTLTRAGETALKLPDDLLILAPHPDDETIMAAGIIRRAVEQGSRVTVAVVTDGNYSKRGNLRRAESLEAMLALGLKEKDIHFLNYPDTGFEPEISFLYNLSGGEREDFVRNLTGLIEKVKPRLVITSSEWDTHGDHAALFALTREALQKSIVRPQLWQSLIHSPAGDDVWPKPNAPEEYFTAPPGFAEWDKRISIPLPEGFSKAGAIRMYPVAIDLREGPEPETEVTRYLLAFAKRDEIFWEADYEDLSC